MAAAGGDPEQGDLQQMASDAAGTAAANAVEGQNGYPKRSQGAASPGESHFGHESVITEGDGAVSQAGAASQAGAVSQASATSEERVARVRQNANEYISKYDLRTVMQELFQSVIKDRPDDPFSFMQAYLAAGSGTGPAPAAALPPHRTTAQVEADAEEEERRALRENKSREEIQLSRSMILSLQQRVHELELKNHDLDVAWRDEREKAAAAAKDSKEAIETAVKESKEAIEATASTGSRENEALHEHMRELDARSSALDTKNRSLEESLTAEKQKCQEHSARCVALEATGKEHEDRARDLSDKYKELQANHVALQARSTGLESDVGSLGDRHRTLEARTQELEGRNRDLDAQYRVLEARNRDLDQRNLGHEMQARELQTQLADVEVARNALDSRNQHLELRNADLEDQQRRAVRPPSGPSGSAGRSSPPPEGGGGPRPPPQPNSGPRRPRSAQSPGPPRPQSVADDAAGPAPDAGAGAAAGAPPAKGDPASQKLVGTFDVGASATLPSAPTMSMLNSRPAGSATSEVGREVNTHMLSRILASTYAAPMPPPMYYETREDDEAADELDANGASSSNPELLVEICDCIDKATNGVFAWVGSCNRRPLYRLLGAEPRYLYFAQVDPTWKGWWIADKMGADDYKEWFSKPPDSTLPVYCGKGEMGSRAIACPLTREVVQKIATISNTSEKMTIRQKFQEAFGPKFTKMEGAQRGLMSKTSPVVGIAHALEAQQRALHLLHGQLAAETQRREAAESHALTMEEAFETLQLRLSMQLPSGPSVAELRSLRELVQEGHETSVAAGDAPRRAGGLHAGPLTGKSELQVEEPQLGGRAAAEAAMARGLAEASAAGSLSGGV